MEDTFINNIGSTSLGAGIIGLSYLIIKWLMSRCERSKCKSTSSCCEMEIDSEKERIEKTKRKSDLKEVLIELGIYNPNNIDDKSSEIPEERLV